MRALDELDDRSLTTITKAALGQLDDTAVAASSFRKTRAQNIEKLLDGLGATQLGKSPTAIVLGVDLAQGDQLLDHGPDSLSLDLGGNDPLMINDRDGHVFVHGFTVACRTAQFKSFYAVTHALALFSGIDSGESTPDVISQ